MATSGNLFEPLSTFNINPASTFGSSAHPLPLLGNLNNSSPIQTNKFYGNWLVGDQSLSVWTHPYSLWWDKPNSAMGVSFRDRSTFVKGGKTPLGGPQYYFAPVQVASFRLGAAELTQDSTKMHLDTPEMMSINSNLVANNAKIWFPVVLGMAFITGKYFDSTPLLSSQVGYRNFEYVGKIHGSVQKYRVGLNDQSNWLVYAYTPNSNEAQILSLQGNFIKGSSKFKQCVIQIANCPKKGNEDDYDKGAGVFVTSINLNSEQIGSLRYQFLRGENNHRAALHFALPHHVDLFDASMKTKATEIMLTTVTKGFARAYLSTEFVLSGNPPNRRNAYFLPNIGDNLSEPIHFDDAVMRKLRTVLEQEVRFSTTSAADIQEKIVNESNVDSIYFSGKHIDKWAGLLLCVKYVLRDEAKAAIIRDGLKQAFQLWISNSQLAKMTYDTAFHGIISAAGLRGDPMADFGNSYYNDHHFHYGYFIHAAAVLGFVDDGWASTPKNKAWVDMLCRDIANPSTKDRFFPVYRSFDWWHGHSWAKGMFASGDSKDQESSSEDVHHAYGLMLWGIISGDSNLEYRSAMQLMLMRQSMNHYYYFRHDNNDTLPEMLPNKISGILFENKIDYTTYFGTEREKIHGIHMLPMTSGLQYVRISSFVKEEWDRAFRGQTDGINSGWKGVLFQNLALAYPEEAKNFFLNNEYRGDWIDDGATWTYALFVTAAIEQGGVPNM